jgi:cell division protein ZapE
LDAAADLAMDAAWAGETEGEPVAPATLSVHGRRVRLPQAGETAARASFDDLCGAALGPADYLAIAERFETLFLDRIPQLSRAKNNEAKRFVTLIDTLYEAKAKFVCSAAAEPDALYVEGDGAFEFQRTASRLNEMRSADWTA